VRHNAVADNIQRVLLATCSTLVSCLVCTSKLKTELTYSTEISVYFQRGTRLYIPEDRNIYFDGVIR
jgi:hypothetical protein